MLGGQGRERGVVGQMLGRVECGGVEVRESGGRVAKGAVGVGGGERGVRTQAVAAEGVPSSSAVVVLVRVLGLLGFDGDVKEFGSVGLLVERELGDEEEEECGIGGLGRRTWCGSGGRVGGSLLRCAQVEVHLGEEAREF